MGLRQKRNPLKFEEIKKKKKISFKTILRKIAVSSSFGLINLSSIDGGLLPDLLFEVV